jgi:putative transposase
MPVIDHNAIPMSIGILQDEADRKVYLELLRQSTEQHGVTLIGYCLMSNHVHLIAE